LSWYLEGHVGSVFAGAGEAQIPEPSAPRVERVGADVVARAAAELAKAERPVAIVGSQAVLDAANVRDVAAALRALAIPTYLSGMARGLLGKDDPVQRRHSRREALREADFVLLAGVPCDFRLDYGRQLPRQATVVAANRSRADLNRNRRPTVPGLGDPGAFLLDLAFGAEGGTRWTAWSGRLAERDAAREVKIATDAAAPSEGGLNPLAVCRAIDAALAESSVLVADGGDFVATASYTVRPRGPLCWLDPGPFGTLGVGGGFAAAAKVARPDSEVWLIWGDGSVGFSLAEFDTLARHKLGVIAVVGNDGCWMQIAREQVEVLGDDVGCTLARSDYHTAAEGLGGRGILVREPHELAPALAEAKRVAAGGVPVLVNVHLGRTDFRKGSISM
jgi:acetolactate synthase-1/2/3 large subunit